ncbi:MAG: hypothetical protein ACREIS_02790 [Nitrospiraceae bacterium]
MRYSPEKPYEIEEVPPKWSNRQFFTSVHRNTTPGMQQGALLLVGGVDFRARAIRQAQASLRLDRQPSAWSHAALLLNWTGRVKAQGAEVALDPEDISLQVPENNGVTFFHLSRYLNERRYPNLCIAVLDVDEDADSELKKDIPEKLNWFRVQIAEAAFNPNRDRVRFPLWDWLGVWAHYIYTTAGATNPVTQGIPLPGAALCEYVYEAAGLDLTPGATAPNACPEILWATIRHWYDRIGEKGIRMKAWRILRDPEPPSKPKTERKLRKEMPGLEKEAELRAMKAGVEKRAREMRARLAKESRETEEWKAPRVERPPEPAPS